MNFPPSLISESRSLLLSWARKENSLSDLKDIFGCNESTAAQLIELIRSGDFGWLPEFRILSQQELGSALGAYSKDLGTAFLSSACPGNVIGSVLLEEIGHHIDALVHADTGHETPGDEGALFSATVRGEILSEEERASLFGENDSAEISLNGVMITVECSVPASNNRTPAPPPRPPANPIIGYGPASDPTPTTIAGDTITTSISYDLSLNSPNAHALLLTGSGNLVGTGNAGNQQSRKNTLSAAQNSGNTTLQAGTVATTLIGGSGNDWLYGSNTAADSMVGGSGNTTMVAGNGNSVLVGGVHDNLLFASSLAGNAQSLWGGTNAASSRYGNTLIGGAGADTLRSGSGYNTLISGSLASVGLSLSSPAAKGTKSLRFASVAGVVAGQTISGSGIAAGTRITAITGNDLSGYTVTISAKTTSSMSSGATIASGSTASTLIGGGMANSLMAGRGNDSLAAVSGNSTLIGASGRVTMLGGKGNNWLQSGSTSTLNGNLLTGGTGSNTLVAGLGRDTINAGSSSNLFLITSPSQATAFSKDRITLSSLSGSANTLGVNSAQAITLGDTLFGSLASASSQTKGLAIVGTVKNLGGASAPAVFVSLGANAEKAGVQTLVSGPGRDTLSVEGYSLSSALLDASNEINRASLVGGGSGNDTFLGSKGGSDTIVGASGNDLIVEQTTNLGSLNGGAGNDTLAISTAGVALQSSSFNSVSNIEVLSLSGGNNLVGSLQGSGITRIVDTATLPASDTFTANVVGSARKTNPGSTLLYLTMPTGATGTMGFQSGQIVTGNGIAPGTSVASATSGLSFLSASLASGSRILTIASVPSFYLPGQTLTGNNIAPGTTITAVDTLNNTVTISQGLTSSLPSGSQVSNNLLQVSLTSPTTALISNGSPVIAALNGVTLDGSAGLGIAPTFQALRTAQDNLQSLAVSIINANYGIPNEVAIDESLTSSLHLNPLTYVHRKGDVLTALGKNEFLTAPNGASLPLLYFPYSFALSPLAGSLNDTLGLHQVIDNTIVSGAFSSNTLIGGDGANLYQIANLDGFSDVLPVIQNPQATTATAQTLQSASTIQFLGKGVQLTDASFSQVGQGSAQIIRTAGGNNLIQIGSNAAQIGIQTIVGGVGADTFTTPLDYVSSVYLDDSAGNGAQSLSSGSGDDTLIAGVGNATLVGGDGNNSLKGGNGTNVILSGSGNSTLDGGYGASTLQADAGKNTFVVRNRYTRILNPGTLEKDSLTGQIVTSNSGYQFSQPETGIVNSYVNFDPLQGAPSQSLSGPWQFAPATPDNSPSLTKSPSFASTDLSSFYNLQYFNLLGSALYGVGNALDNTMSAVAPGALMLGMGGNNTLVASGDGSSLYGDSNPGYVSPDIYAAAPTDTRDQQFIDGVMGISGNNSLVASGNYSYLDGGSGYDNGLLDGSGSNTLSVLGGYLDTLVQWHQGDQIILNTGSTTQTLASSTSATAVFSNGSTLSTGSSTLTQTSTAYPMSVLISHVDLNVVPNYVNNVVLDVSPALPNSGMVSLAGQQVTPGLVVVSGGQGGYINTSSGKPWETSLKLTIDQVQTLTPANVDHALQVIYDGASGTTYSTDGSGDLPLAPQPINPDGNHPGKLAVPLSWNVPTVTGAGGQPVVADRILGYTVQYQAVAYQQDPNTPGQPLLDTNGNPVLASETLDGNGNAVPLTDANGNPIAPSETPYLTYLKGTSRDINGTSINPSLTVDNLPSSFTNGLSGITYSNGTAGIVYSFNFKVTTNQEVLPSVSDISGNLTGRPVTLVGGAGNDVLYGGLLTDFSPTLLGTTPTPVVLNNNPVDPNSPSGIKTPAPWVPVVQPNLNFPVSLDGGNGNDLLIAPQIGYTTDTTGLNSLSGQNFTAYQTFQGTVRPVTFSGLNTLVGGIGSDTFVVSNGGASLSTLNGIVTTAAYDQVVKFGNETPLGQSDLVISRIPYLSLSDTDVSQGKFIGQLELSNNLQFGSGNRLDNTLTAFGYLDTLMGGGGRDSLFINTAQWSGAFDTLIGGTAYGTDSILGAMGNYYGVVPDAPRLVLDTVFGDSLYGSLVAQNTVTGAYYLPSSDPLYGSLAIYNTQTGTYSSPTQLLQQSSIYRDTDPVPAGLISGPGAADNSQYWTVAGAASNNPSFDPLRNSDTLVSSLEAGKTGAYLDGGAGNDLMVGGKGSDTMVVSSAMGLEGNWNLNPNNTVAGAFSGGGDAVVGGGGNDWIIYTGSDAYWSGTPGATSQILGYALDNNGDASYYSPAYSNFNGGVTNSVSNILLQPGDPVARYAYGSNSSAGNQHKSDLGTESGSNKLVANEFNDTLDGGGVTSVGCDTLVGGGTTTFQIASTGAFGYSGSSNDVPANYSTSQVNNTLTGGYTNTYTVTNAPTDATWALAQNFTVGSKLALSGYTHSTLTGAQYAIGAAPSSFSKNNIQGTQSFNPSDFGIYLIQSGKAPNLVAEIQTSGQLTSLLTGSLTHNVGDLTVAGTQVSGSSGFLGYNQFAWTTPGMSSDLQAAGLNYLGYGEMWNLTGSAFDKYVL